MKEASFYVKLFKSRIQCVLCPHNCLISEGNRGKCRVRLNIGGSLFSEVYGNPVAIKVDPIEKKPLYHFYPGYQVLSIGTVGCNMKCMFCQNCEISQASGEEMISKTNISIDYILQSASEKQRNIGLAFTYNEPTIYYEYMSDLAKEIHNAGMKNIMVSNGFINPEPLSRLLTLIDAFNIDLKSFENDFYTNYTDSNLEPVLNTIKTIYKSGRQLELTFLVIPGLNDDTEVFNKMVEWIRDETDRKTVLHISRYFPLYKINTPPTPQKTLESLYHQAKKVLDYVYLGNIQGSIAQDTYCPICKKVLLVRTGYHTSNEGLDKEGFCINCKEKVISFMTL